MNATNAKRIVLGLATLWLLVWGIVGVATEIAWQWTVTYFVSVALFVGLGAWGERRRWLPFTLALVLTALVAAATLLFLPVILGALVVCGAILIPPDEPEPVGA